MSAPTDRPLVEIRVYQVERVPLPDLPAWMTAHNAHKKRWWATPQRLPWIMEVEVEECTSQHMSF